MKQSIILPLALSLLPQSLAKPASWDKCDSCQNYWKDLETCFALIKNPATFDIHLTFPGNKTIECVCASHIPGKTGLKTMENCKACLAATQATHPLLHNWIETCKTDFQPGYGIQSAKECWNSELKTGCYTGA